MKNKLPPEFLARLDVNVSFHMIIASETQLTHHKRIPKIEQLHRGFLDIALYYQRSFGLALPPLNSSLLLYRHIKRLAIPSKTNGMV